MAKGVAIPLLLETHREFLTRIEMDLWLPASLSVLSVTSPSRCQIRVRDFQLGSQIELFAGEQVRLPDRIDIEVVISGAADAETMFINAAISGPKGRRFLQMKHAVISTVGQEWLTGAAGPAARKRLVRRGIRPSSSDLIDRALAAGTIDPETALIYKVYAVFADQRLPAQYQGDDSQRIDSGDLAEAAIRFDSLSAAAQSALTPFLIPAMHGGSWWHLRQSSASPDRTPSSITICGPVDTAKWSPVSATTAPIKVWWEISKGASEQQLAGAVRNVIDAGLWRQLVSLMGRSPLLDGGSTLPCRGGSDEIDILIINQGLSETVPFWTSGTKKAPTFMYLSKASPNGMQIALIHELMHTVQFAFDVRDFHQFNYKWLMEATATWFQDYILPAGDSGKEHRAAPLFLSTTEKPLETLGGEREYGAYLLFFYLHRKFGDPGVVRKSWEATESNDNLQAVDVSIPGGFKDRWPEFALHNWNRDKPFDFYQQWDQLKDAAPQASISASLGSSGDNEIVVFDTVEHLAAQYVELTFGDPRIRTVMFANGLGYSVTKKPPPQGPDLGVQYITENAPEEKRKGAKIQGLVKIAAKDWKAEDWTDEPWVMFCRDDPNEQLEAMVILYSNSEHENRGHRLEPTSDKPLVWISSVPCWKLSGQVKIKAKPSSDVPWDVTMRLTWEVTRGATAAQVQFPPGGLFPPTVNFTAKGLIEWSANGTGGDGCSYSGGGSFPVGAAGVNNLQIWSHTPPGGPMYRTYHNGLIPLTTVTISQACPNQSPTTVPTIVPPWVLPAPLGGAPGFRVAPDGTMRDRWEPDNVTMEWDFKPVP